MYFCLVYFVSSDIFYSFSSYSFRLHCLALSFLFFLFLIIFLRDSPAREKGTQFSIVRTHLKERRKGKCSEGVWNYSELKLQESSNKDKIIAEASKHPKLCHFVVWPKNNGLTFSLASYLLSFSSVSWEITEK